MTARGSAFGSHWRPDRGAAPVSHRRLTTISKTVVPGSRPATIRRTLTFRDRWRCFFATIGPIARGDFRLQQRLFVQIERVMKINQLNVIATDVVESARSTLVIGDIWR